MKIRDRIKSFKRVPASQLLPNPKNWRKHPESQQNAMRGILAEVGMADAVLARETPAGLMLIDGHLRAELAPDAKLPVLVLDVTEEEADKILLTHDIVTEMAAADPERLRALVESAELEAEELEAMLDAYLAELEAEQPEEPEDVEDVVPQADRAEELAQQWGTASGQLWVIEGKQTHRLLCGDATKEDAVGTLLAGETPFIMVTDPPYGVEYDPAWRNEAAAKGLIKGLIASAASREGNVDNDDRVDWTPAYQLFTGPVAYVWHASWFISDVMQQVLASDFTIRALVIWRKPSFAISRGHYHWQHEPCWYAVRKGASARWCGDRSQSTVWDISNRLDEADGKTNHGTQKPLECMARPIRNHGAKGDIVYDPFLGSGTTMLAAERLGRRCFGLEISPKYCAVILQRMTDAGCKCRLASDG